ncbi:chitin deacetylase [Coprinopsis marcescibilis]|uniref:chitin deacetylase n=1 Tax=Coprinopsis marcescibilis TaxID=230819 RepID=A0A5C3KEE1_COPMA|nr:chitin deacetylase [Coprinopsis marcescibilis]
MKLVTATALLSLLGLANAHGDRAAHRRHVENLAARQARTCFIIRCETELALTLSDVLASFLTSLDATNPTAVPLSAIVPGAVSRVTQTVEATIPAGTRPSAVPNAPGLPDCQFNQNKAQKYPKEDKVPPTDSPQVKRWKEEVKNSGVPIPNFSPTVEDADCRANPAAVAETSRCWWTCGQCEGKNEVSTCKEKNHWGLTFDDGPAFHTKELLDYLDEVKLKATFFVVGSRVYFLPEVLQHEYISGHQIAIHTWSHSRLTTLTDDQVIAELGWSKEIIREVLGVTPTHMRPPYGDIDDRVRNISLAMGLTPVMWTRNENVAFNTQDFEVFGNLTTIEQVLTNWNGIKTASANLDTGFIVLQHDLNQQAVDAATGYIIPDGLAQSPAWTIEPVINCLNMPMANAYIETNDNATNPFIAKLDGSAIATAGGPGWLLMVVTGLLLGLFAL